MLNQVVLVGRLVREAELRETDNKKKVTTITLAVPRSFKNMNGEYDTDFIDCTLWENIAESTITYCHKGNILGIKGRLQVRNFEDQAGGKRHVLEVIAEKVTFLSSSNEKEK